MNKLKKISQIVILFILVILSVSCRRASIDAGLFEASLSVSSTRINDGEEFSFTLKANRSKIRVVSFDFPLAPSLIKEDTVYEVPSNGWTTSVIVSVPITQKGKLHLCVEDIDTGAQKSFEIDYQAYRSAKIEIEIKNAPAEGTKFGYDYKNIPAVIEGDDFSFVIYSKIETLILKNFNCEFNNGQLVENSELSFKGENEKKYTFKTVSVDSDKYEKPCELSLTFYVPETQKDTTVTAKYIRLKKFSPEVTLEPSTLAYNDVCSIKFASNRPISQLVSHKEPAWFVITDLGEELDKVFYTKPLNIPEGENDGVLEFEFKDVEYTNRTKKITIPYHIAKNIPPKDIAIEVEDKYSRSSDGSFVMYQEDLLHVKVSTSTRNSDNLYNVSVKNTPSGSYSATNDISLYAPQKGQSREESNVLKYTFAKEVTVTDNDFYIKANSNTGYYQITISAKNDSSVSQDIFLSVKNSVMFVVEMETEQSQRTYDYWIHTWKLIPTKVTGYFASWENTTHPVTYLTDVKNWGYSKCVAFHETYLNSLTKHDDVKELIVKSSIDYGPSSPNVCTWNYYRIDKYFTGWPITGHTLPKAGEELISISDTTTIDNDRDKKFILDNAKDRLRELDCYGNIVERYEGSMKEPQHYIRPKDYWTHFNFDITSFEGIEKTYKVKYILYVFKIPMYDSIFSALGGPGTIYWWKSIDNVGILVDVETGTNVY